MRAPKRVRKTPSCVCATVESTETLASRKPTVDVVLTPSSPSVGNLGIRPPQRESLAKQLARHDWSGVFSPTEDFVVFIAEHDEGFALKYESLLEVNPPERIAAWEARWPECASRGEDEQRR